MSKLAVVTVVENPLGWKSRRDNYRRFANNMKACDVELYTVEIAYKDKNRLDKKFSGYEVTSSNDPKELRLTSDCILWHKENALNLLIQRIDVDYIAWIDADVSFTNLDWAYEAIQLLQKYKIVQLFSHAQYLGSSFQPLGVVRPSYAYQWKTEGKIAGGIDFWGNKPKDIPPERMAQSGLGYAASKQTLSDLGGLIDWCIAGSGDFHMMASFLSQLSVVVSKEGFTESYIKKCSLWQQMCNRYMQGKISYVPGLIYHYWHGAHGSHRKQSYRNITKEFKYDPDLDIKRDWQGLYTTTGNNPKLYAAIEEDAKSRNEDESSEILIP